MSNSDMGIYPPWVYVLRPNQGNLEYTVDGPRLRTDAPQQVETFTMHSGNYLIDGDVKGLPAKQIPFHNPHARGNEVEMHWMNLIMAYRCDVCRRVFITNDFALLSHNCEDYPATPKINQQ